MSAHLNRIDHVLRTKRERNLQFQIPTGTGIDTSTVFSVPQLCGSLALILCQFLHRKNLVEIALCRGH